MRLPSRISQAIRITLLDQTAYHSAAVLAGQFSRLVLGLLSSALLARSLGPSGLAAFAVVGSLLMIAVSVADFGLSQSAVRQLAALLRLQPAEALETTGSFARWKLIAGLTVTAIMLLAAAPLAAFLDLPSDDGPAMIAVAAAGLVAAVLGGIVSTVLQAQSRFRALAGGQSVNAALTVLLIGLLFLAGRLTTIPALWVGAVSALAAAAFGYFILAPAWRRALWKAGRLRGSLSQQLLSFSKWMWLSAILAILTAQADLLMVNRLLPSQTAGIYALALSLYFKADILHQTLHTVLLPAASALSTRDQFRLYARQNLIRSLLLSLLLLLAGIVAPPFVKLVYGSEFSASSTVFRWMLLIAIFDLLTTPPLLLAYPLNLPRAITAASLLRVGLLLVLGSQLIPHWGLGGAVVAKLVAKAAGALLLGTAIARRLPQVAEDNLEAAALAEISRGDDPDPGSWRKR